MVSGSSPASWYFADWRTRFAATLFAVRYLVVFFVVIWVLLKSSYWIIEDSLPSSFDIAATDCSGSVRM